MIVLQHLKCQFGNILFQLIAGSYFAKIHSLDYYWASYDAHEIHFDSDYDYILNNFKKYDYHNQREHLDTDNLIKMEIDFDYQNIPFIKNKNYEFRGYFQNWTYIDREYALNVLSPSMNIINKINNIMPLHDINNYSIGVHLRYHDYENQYKPFANDPNRLGKFILEHDDKQILIFTDDLTKVQHLKQYDNVIIFSELTNSFLLDFYALSQCKIVVGGLSTFFIWTLCLNLHNPDIYYIKESLDFYENQFKEFNTCKYIYNNDFFNPSLFKGLI